MFTGIVEELGTVLAFEPAGAGARLRVGAAATTKALAIGDSVAVNGCCLTAVEIDAGAFALDVIAETLARTNLGGLTSGESVNLERPTALGDRLGGHLVQGHVDAVATILEGAPHLRVALAPSLARYCVEKGSIALDGCSLTVAEALGKSVRVELIPHTIAVTTLGRKGAGALVNVEVDVVAKYVESLLRAGVSTPYALSRVEGGQ